LAYQSFVSSRELGPVVRRKSKHLFGRHREGEGRPIREGEKVSGGNHSEVEVRGARSFWERGGTPGLGSKRRGKAERVGSGRNRISGGGKRHCLSTSERFANCQGTRSPGKRVALGEKKRREIRRYPQGWGKMIFRG